MLLFIDHKTFQGAGELVAMIGEDEWTSGRERRRALTNTKLK
jgi:hypothetical protein